MNPRSLRSNWITLPHWRHRATQSAPTLCPSLLHAAEDSRQGESSWRAEVQRLARNLQTSFEAQARPRSRDSAHRLPEIAGHVIVTNQHRQRQASSCIDNRPRERQHPLGNQLTDGTQKGSPHRLCSLTANTEVRTPPVLLIAVCVAMRNVSCKELQWLFPPVSGTCLQNHLAIRRRRTHRVV